MLCLLLALIALPAQAQVEARSVALQNGCRPTKIEPVQQVIGSVAEATYAITCENKTPSAGSAEPRILKVRCRNKQCFVLN